MRLGDRGYRKADRIAGSDHHNMKLAQQENMAVLTLMVRKVYGFPLRWMLVSG